MGLIFIAQATKHINYVWNWNGISWQAADHNFTLEIFTLHISANFIIDLGPAPGAAAASRGQAAGRGTKLTPS